MGFHSPRDMLKMKKIKIVENVNANFCQLCISLNKYNILCHHLFSYINRFIITSMVFLIFIIVLSYQNPFLYWTSSYLGQQILYYLNTPTSQHIVQWLKNKVMELFIQAQMIFEKCNPVKQGENIGHQRNSNKWRLYQTDITRVLHHIYWSLGPIILKFWKLR